MLAIPGPELLPVAVPVVSPDAQQPDEIRVGQAADGRSVIAFISDDRLYVQRRAADGSAAGDATQILQDSGKQLSGLSLAVGANGHYTIGVQTVDAGVGRIFIRRYNPDGTRLLVAGESDTGPLTVAFDGPPTCGSNGIAGQGQPAVAVDAAGNSAYTFTRVNYCPTGPGGALQPERTRLLYRYAPVDAPAADPVALFEQSPVTSAGFRVVDAVGSSVALQDDGNGLVAWVGHPEANQTPATYVRPVQFGLATAPEQRIDATNSFNRDAPVLGAKSNGYVLNWRGDFNDPQSGNRRQPCYVQARALDGSAQFAVQTVPGCGRNQIVLPDGRFELISSIGANLVGRRYDANGVETGSYGGGSRPNRFLDRIASAWSPRLANGNYLAIYNVDQADGSRATLEPVRYGGPDGTPQLNLEINPTGPLTISDGRTVSLFWTSNAPAGSCFGFGNLSGPLPSSGSRVLGSFTTAATRSYGIACGTGELRKSVTLEIVDSDAVTVTASWNPSSIVSGNRATVSWNATNADSCTYELSGALADVGSGGASGAIEYAFPDAGEARFDLSCTGAGGRTGTTSASITIGTPLPLTVTAAWSPTTIFSAGSSTLTWTSENAAACTGTYAGIRNDTGPVDASGSFVFQPGNAAGTQTFTLECAGVDGEVESTTATLTVNAVVPTVSASWVSPTIRVGETPFVMWSSTDALACEGSFAGLVNNAPFAVDASGMTAVSLPFDMAGTVDFTLSCVGAGGGRASTTARLTVNAITPTVSASWVSPSIRVGETPFVTWSSTDALACEASFDGLVNNAPFAVEASGMTAVSLPFDTAGIVDFTLSCVGPGGGRASTTARLTVNAVTPTVSASWLSPSIRVGETPFVTWSSNDALACEASFDGLVNNAPFAVEASGMTAVSLPFDTAGIVDFTLSCVGPGGATASTTARLTVNAVVPAVSASWVNPSIVVGDTPLLMWSSSYAIACQGSFDGLIVNGPFAIAASGMNAVSLPGDVTGTVDFTLDCVGPGGGRAVTTARLTINAAPPPPPPPPVNLGSITLTDGREVQLTSSAGAIVNTRVTARPAVLPAGFTPLTDFLAFDITSIPVGGSVEVTLTFPAGVTPNGYVKCTPDCALFDRAVINGNQVRLALTDGGAGDGDGVADGVIRDPGAPGVVTTAPPPATGGGGAAGGLLPLLGVALLLRRRRVAR
ncbi:MAG: hypothetical protein NTZ11_16720 [Gammaproteobacteria bacterium]|nr:hypothetical protein [Gammaproteobacteria bacterium]